MVCFPPILLPASNGNPNPRDNNCCGEKKLQKVTFVTYEYMEMFRGWVGWVAVGVGQQIRVPLLLACVTNQLLACVDFLYFYYPTVIGLSQTLLSHG